MSGDTQARAVAAFEALLDAAGAQGHASPARLIQAAGLPSSTGYRHVAALEAEGWLRRDAAGTYLPGGAVLRTGLGAFGVGRLAPVVQPILLQLRQATQHTAFVAVAEGPELRMGPHAPGRMTRAVRLQRLYGFEAVPDLRGGEVTRAWLRCREGDTLRRLGVALACVAAQVERQVVLGLVLDPARADQEPLELALRHAVRQARESGEVS